MMVSSTFPNAVAALVLFLFQDKINYSVKLTVKENPAID